MAANTKATCSAIGDAQSGKGRLLTHNLNCRYADSRLPVTLQIAGHTARAHARRPGKSRRAPGVLSAYPDRFPAKPTRSRPARLFFLGANVKRSPWIVDEFRISALAHRWNLREPWLTLLAQHRLRPDLSRLHQSVDAAEVGDCKIQPSSHHVRHHL